MNKDATGDSTNPVSNQTAFQLHTLHSNNNTINVVDLTEHKLKRLAVSVIDFQQKMVVTKMLTDYLSGKVAVAWRSGAPLYIKVTKG